MNKEVDLSISCYGKVKDRRYDIVALPWGATEPHNLHLGDPRRASTEKGKKFAEAVAQKYAKLFDELVNMELY